MADEPVDAEAQALEEVCTAQLPPWTSLSYAVSNLKSSINIDHGRRSCAA